MVFFFMTLLLLMACLFTFGLLSLLTMQVKNFFTGMTTMERLGAPSHRNRKFTFVDEIEEFAQTNTMEFDDQERHLPPLSTADSDGYTRVLSTQDQHVQDAISGLGFPTNSHHHQSNSSLQLKIPQHDP